MMLRSAMLGLVGPSDTPATLVSVIRVGPPGPFSLRCDRAYHAPSTPNRTSPATPPTTPPAMAAVFDLCPPPVAPSPRAVPLLLEIVEGIAVTTVVTTGTEVAVPLIVVCDSNVLTTEDECVTVVGADGDSW